MATRSERYLFVQDETKSRVARNQQLYDSIYEEDTYYQETPKAAAIEKTNEIDIEKVKELLKGREIYRRELKMRELNMINSEDSKPVEQEEPEEKSYDINAYLDKAASERETEPYHKIDLAELTEPVLEEEEKEEPSPEDLKEMGTTELSLNLFDDFSKTQTIDTEDDDESEEDEEEEEDTTELVATITQTDTFFTDSVKLAESEEDDDEEEEKSSSLIKIIMGLLILVIIALVIFVIVM